MSGDVPRATLHIAGDDAPVSLPVAAAVFDCDGLLMDSESVWVHTLTAWLGEQGLDGVHGDDFLGLSAEETARRLAERSGPADSETTRREAARLAESLSVRYSAQLTAAVPPMPGAIDLITTLSRQVPVAVASNGLREDVERLLQQAGILPLLHALCTIEDVEHGKPDPDLYLTAVRRLGSPTGPVVAFEDSPAGAAAARAAGLTVLGVNADLELALPAHHRLRGLDQISVTPSATHPQSPDRIRP